MPKTTKRSTRKSRRRHGDIKNIRQQDSSPTAQSKVDQKRRGRGDTVARTAPKLTCYDLLWNAMYDRLLEFKREHGHCTVVKSYKDPEEYSDKPKLSVWVQVQRRKYISGVLLEDRKKRLDEIGFVWGRKLADNWEDMFERLVEFKQQYGHCAVPTHYKDPEKYKGKPKLGAWVGHQRQSLRNDILPNDLCWRLDELGFVWKRERFEERWNDMFRRLLQYKEEHGDCLVPSKYEPDRQLGRWVCLIRSRHEGQSYEHKRRLDEIGFVWKLRASPRK